MPLPRQRPAVVGRLASLAAAGWLAASGLQACSDPLVLDDSPTVSLSPASITAAPGDTFRVRVTATGGAPVGSVVLAATGTAARVDADGLVTAIAPGTGVVSATFDFNGQRVTGSIPVTVLGITIDPVAATIVVGGTTFIRAVPVGDFAAFGGFRWSSSDSTVAFVDLSGAVRGLRPGIARIAVSAINNPRVRAEATVTVQCTAALLGSLTVSPASVTLATGASQQLEASGTVGGGCGAPALVVRDFTYRTSDTTVATVSATGLVTGRRAGAAVITVAAVAVPTVTQAVTVTVREQAPGSALSVRSITAGDPPATVDLGAVRGAIAVALNVRSDAVPGPLRVELRLAGRTAAVQQVPAAPSGTSELIRVATVALNTAARDAGGALLYPNGAQTLEIRGEYGCENATTACTPQTLLVTVPLTLANPATGASRAP